MPAFKASSPNPSRARAVARRRSLFVLAVAAMIVVPAAISWACGPNRQIQLDRYEATPGQTINVTGSNFYENIDVSILVNNEPVASARTSGTGTLSGSFSAPSAAGVYTVHTDGVNPDTGQALAGTGTPQSLVVKAPATSGTTSGGNGSPSTGKTAPAPGTTTGTQPGTTRQSDSSRTSGREQSRSGARERSGSGTTRGTSGSGSPTAGGVNTTAGVVETSSGTTAFAGSVTRADRAAAAKAKPKSKAAARSKARPAQSTASADLWSGFASSKNPSLMADGAGAGIPAAETSSGVTAGLLLLGVGLLGVLGLGGMAIADRRRRRAHSG